MNASGKVVVILDEFNGSGGTRDAIFRMMHLLDKDIIAYLSLANFNPQESIDANVACLSLYEWQTRYALMRELLPNVSSDLVRVWRI